MSKSTFSNSHSNLKKKAVFRSDISFDNSSSVPGGLWAVIITEKDDFPSSR